MLQAHLQRRGRTGRRTWGGKEGLQEVSSIESEGGGEGVVERVGGRAKLLVARHNPFVCHMQRQVLSAGLGEERQAPGEEQPD